MKKSEEVLSLIGLCKKKRGLAYGSFSEACGGVYSPTTLSCKFTSMALIIDSIQKNYFEIKSKSVKI